MPLVSTEGKRLSDVLSWVVDQGYCVRKQPVINNGSLAVAKNSSLLGLIAINLAGTWKILDNGDGFNGTQELAVVVDQRNTLADFAADANNLLLNGAVVKNGPAKVHKAGLSIGAGVTASAVYAKLEAQGIQVVEETGVAFKQA